MSQPSFAGSVPENYEKYLVPLVFDDYAEDLVERVDVPSTGSLLETACGTGVVTRKLRARLPRSVKIVATDLNPSMLEIARARSHDQEHLEFQIVDASALPFDDRSFDAIVCQFGVMFLPDKALGYREAARVLRPGGHFLMSVWDSLENNAIMQFVHELMPVLLPEDPPSFFSIPFGYNDKAEIEQLLLASHFDSVRVTVLRKESRASNATHVARALTRGSPLAGELETRAATESVYNALEAAIRNEFGEGEVTAPMQAIVFDARVAG